MFKEKNVSVTYDIENKKVIFTTDSWNEIITKIDFDYFLEIAEQIKKIMSK